MPKRIFIAIKIRPSDQLISVYDKLRQSLQTDRIKWVVIGNLHVTLKFLGDVGEQLLPEIIAVLKKVAKAYTPFEIKIKSIGKFSKKGHAKVIWLDIKDSGNNLASIATSLNNAYKLLGFNAGYKPFKAHLTLGRVKHIQNEHILNSFITNYSSQEIQKNTVEEIVIFESILKNRKNKYIPIDIIKLRPPLIINLRQDFHSFS